MGKEMRVIDLEVQSTYTKLTGLGFYRLADLNKCTETMEYCISSVATILLSHT